MQALSPELSKTVEELKAQADKMKAELEDKAAQAGTTVEDQIKEIKSAAENAEKPQNAISVEEAAEAEKTPTDLTALKLTRK